MPRECEDDDHGERKDLLRRMTARGEDLCDFWRTCVPGRCDECCLRLNGFRNVQNRYDIKFDYVAYDSDFRRVGI